MKPNHVILGVGEIGSAYVRILAPKYRVFRVDIRPELSDPADILPDPADVLHICLRYTPRFLDIVKAAVEKFQPRLINNMTTCPPGITEQIAADACHSTTRGLHPHLEAWVRTGTKHIGGPDAAALAQVFAAVGIKTVVHDQAKTTELAHIMSNALYGVQIMFADEMDRLCREYGVDYFEAVQLYSMTHNQGYAAAGVRSKFRPILTPPHGRIGGHCVTQGAGLIPEKMRGPLLDRLAAFNQEADRGHKV